MASANQMAWIKSIWRDPVWSKVISALIIAAGAVMFTSVKPFASSILFFPVQISVIWLIVVCLVVALLVGAIAAFAKRGTRSKEVDLNVAAPAPQMIEIKGETFVGQKIILDGHTYIRCTFRGCAMVYAGSPHMRLVENRFDGCTWTFDGAASATIAFMGAIYKSGGPVAQNLIEGTFDTIRGKLQDAGQR